MNFFQAIPAAAVSPLALVAYIVAVAATVVLALRLKRNRSLLDHIRHLPAAERRQALQEEMNVVVPKEITAEQWLRSRQHTYFFAACMMACLCVTIIFLVTLTKTGGGDPALPLNAAGTSAPVAAPTAAPGNVADTERRNPPPSDMVDQGPTEFEPVLLEGRTIDACIREARYEALQQQCSMSAQRLVAGAFCVRKGFNAAQKWTIEDTGVKQNSFKLKRGLTDEGQVSQEFVADDDGGTILASVMCR